MFSRSILIWQKKKKVNIDWWVLIENIFNFNEPIAELAKPWLSDDGGRLITIMKHINPHF